MASKIFATAFLASLCCALPAQATTFSAMFDFSAPLMTEENVEGVEIGPASGDAFLRVTPYGDLIGGTPAENDMVDTIKGDWGLGLLNKNAANDRSMLFNRVHVDGKDGAEVIRLVFSHPVRVDEVFFAFVGAFEKFDLAIDGNPIDVAGLLGTDVIYDLVPPMHVPGLVRLPDTLPLGTTWEFFARNMGDEWNIESLGVSTPVPEPSTMFALASLATMGLVVGFRRRRS